MRDKTTLQHYIDKHGLFWKTKNPSQKLDHLIAANHIRKSIQSDELNQQLWQNADDYISVAKLRFDKRRTY